MSGRQPARTGAGKPGFRRSGEASAARGSLAPRRRIASHAPRWETRDRHRVRQEPILTLRIVRLGSPREAGQGLRIRAVHREDLARRDFYDVWFPNHSPSNELLRAGLAVTGERAWKRFARGFAAEAKTPAARRDLDLLAALSHHTDLTIGC